ncbi:MAG TPA: GMC family oxidoreductase [Stellaceae bacterium]|nr:GMC family oxidoreductase [Stellaceae bacterium]
MNGFKNFLDARQITQGTVLEGDLCIIGAGAAGITLARAFADTGVQVILLETGGPDYEADIQDLGTIENVGRPYDVAGCRLRYFGGSTNHWGGHCVRLEALDFETRDWIPYSGWPFGLEELTPYYDRAHKVIEIGGTNDDPALVAKALKYRLFPFAPEKVKTTLSRYNPQRFGLRYGGELDSASNLKICLYATVTSIDLDASHRRVAQVTVNTLARNPLSVRAKRFVLATGGIENARLLLDSDKDEPKGVGNTYDLVGRFFMEHIFYPNSIVLPAKIDPAYDIYSDEYPYVDGDRLEVRCHLALPMELTRELRIPKFRTEISLSTEPAHRLFSEDFSAEDVARLFSRVTDKLGRMVRGKPWMPTCYRLDNNVEQIPNPDSRISLSAERNALGQRVARLDWRLSNLDREGIRAAHRMIAQEVGRTGFGRYRSFLPEHEDAILEGADGGMHHMGTTRMNDDPKQGVVDKNSKVHGLANLYIAGSSVFPCCGWSNPTLTITALALRLADHLKGEITSRD